MKIYMETKRLILRQYTGHDAQNLLELNTDPVIRRWLPDVPVEPGKIQEHIKQYALYYRKYDGYGVWAMIEKSTQKHIGWFMFLPVQDLPWYDPELNRPGEIELGFCLKPDTWGKGYATEAALSVISKAFAEPGVRHIIGTCLAANTASIRVMEKAGMKPDKKNFYGKLETIRIPPQEVIIFRLDKEAYQRENCTGNQEE